MASILHTLRLYDAFARGSIYTTIMELGPQNHNGDGLLGPRSITVVYMDPLGSLCTVQLGWVQVASRVFSVRWLSALRFFGGCV